MSELQVPVVTALPPPPSDDFLTKDQWDTLFALLDAALPSIASASAITNKNDQIAIPDEEFHRIVHETTSSLENGPSNEKVAEFLAFRPSENPRFREDVLRTIAASPQRDQLAKALGLLGTHAGSLFLTGYWTPVTKQPASVREAILRSWASSRLLMCNLLAKNMYMIAQKANGTTSPYLQSISGYTDAPKNWKPVDGYDFKFIQLDSDSDGVHEITTDVVIVGSGCGGAVSAKNIAEAGHKVLVVDKGYYFPPNHLPMTQEASFRYLYDRGGAYASEDSSSSVICGGVWGGGGTVNWSVCFRLQDYVRQEWADEGLPLFTSPEFDECMDRVWDFVGASTGGIRHNHRNKMILEGSKKLGWHSAPVNQNTANKEHYCGQCHLGCGSAEKRGPTVAWLPAAAEAGAEFMEGFRVEKVLFADDGVTATGVEGVWTARDAAGGVSSPESERTQRRVIIKAKKVIVSSGSLWSPIVLMNSGIKNSQLGSNLHLHPVNCVTAVHREETNPWEGGIITSYSGEFENLDGKGHGVKLEPVCMVPYLVFAVQGWKGGLDAKLLNLKFRHLSGFISLCRDRDTGRVFPDPNTGEPRIDYTASDFDREHILEGLIGLTKICYVGGATDIRTNVPGLHAFLPDPVLQEKHVEGSDPEFTDPAFGNWIQQLRTIGNKPPVALFSSAHQMGTCRMSAKEDTGVVDEKGSVWGRKNLYVADASVFPSASGVNPMVTTMSIADWISRGVAKELSTM